MDTNVGYWDRKEGLMHTRFLTSYAFEKALEGINVHKILQLSIDGSNVNYEFVNDLEIYLKTSVNDPVFLYIVTVTYVL